MLRYLLSFSLALLPSLAFGTPSSLQLISGVPSFYTPGEAIGFEVSLPAISNLGSYNIDVVLQGSAGTAGVDYFFDAGATAPATTHYVFPSTGNYIDAVTLDSPTRNRITLTDFSLAGANVVGGVNDQVAHVVFKTSASYHGSLSLFVDAPLLILDSSNPTSTPVNGFSGIQDGIAGSAPIAVTVVPEPTVLTLLLFAASLLTWARRDWR